MREILLASAGYQQSRTLHDPPSADDLSALPRLTRQQKNHLRNSTAPFIMEEIIRSLLAILLLIALPGMKFTSSPSSMPRATMAHEL
jgi:hypothetical protein